MGYLYICNPIHHKEPSLLPTYTSYPKPRYWPTISGQTSLIVSDYIPAAIHGKSLNTLIINAKAI